MNKVVVPTLLAVLLTTSCNAAKKLPDVYCSVNVDAVVIRFENTPVDVAMAQMVKALGPDLAGLNRVSCWEEYK